MPEDKVFAGTDESGDAIDFIDGATEGSGLSELEENLDNVFTDDLVDESEDSGEEESNDEPDFEQLANDIDDRASETQAKPEPKESGAERRIRQLVDRAKTAEQGTAQLQQQLQMQNQQMQQQYQAQQTALQQQNGVLQQKLDSMYQTSEQDRYEKMSVADQIKHDATKSSRSTMDAEIAKAIAPLQQRFAQQEQQAQANQQQYERQQRLAYYQQEASQALPNIVFNGIEDTEGLNEPMEEILLAHAGAFGLTPAQSAPHVRKLLDTYANAVIKSRAKASKKVRAAQKTGQPSANARNPGKGRATTKFDPKKHNNAMDYFDELADDMFD